MNKIPLPKCLPWLPTRTVIEQSPPPPTSYMPLGVIQVLRNARGGGWVYAQALRSVTRGWGGGATSALRNVIFV